MRLVLDIQATQTIGHPERGIARYVAEHASSLVAAGVVSRLGLNPYMPFPSGLSDDLLDSDALAWNDRAGFHAVDDPTAYVVMSPFEGGGPADVMFPPFARERRVPLVATLYDLIPLLHAEEYLREADQRRRYLQRVDSLRSVDLLLCISQQTQRDAIAHLGVPESRTAVIYAGVSPFFHPAPPEEAAGPVAPDTLAALGGTDAPFVLCVGGDDHRKNLDGLLLAWARVDPGIRRTCRLVIACRLSPENLERLLGIAAEVGLTPAEVHFTGFVSDATLRDLYRRTTLMVFPSHYEGFGLPAAEALECGAPVIISDAGSLPEVIDWPAASFSPTDHDALAILITKGIADDAYRSELLAHSRARQGHFHWGEVARRTVDAIGAIESKDPFWLAARATRPPAPVRPRVAVAATLDPAARPGDAATVGVLNALAAMADVTVFTPAWEPAIGAVPEAAGLHPAVQTAPLYSLGRVQSPFAYDGVLTVLGDHESQAEVLAQGLRLPGPVWLPDGGVGRAYAGAAAHVTNPVWLPEQVRDFYGRGLGPIPPATWVRSRTGLRMTRVFGTRPLVVGSEQAARRVAFDRGPWAPPPPLTVLPTPGDAPGGAAAPSYEEAAAALLTVMSTCTGASYAKSLIPSSTGQNAST